MRLLQAYCLHLPFPKVKERSFVSAAEKLECLLSKSVSFFVLPVFALANICFVIHWEIGKELFTSVNSLGIILGLLIGKPLSITPFSQIAVTKLAYLPSAVSWSRIIGVGFLDGIGFTMSIFITLLAFDDTSLQSNSKASILIASVLSGIIDFLILKITPKAKV